MFLHFAYAHLKLLPQIEVPKRALSRPEQHLHDFLASLEVPFEINNQTILSQRKQIDILLPSYHLGIEVNGSYYHSSRTKLRNYHLNKTREAADKGLEIKVAFLVL